jgi:hypothetical protein
MKSKCLKTKNNNATARVIKITSKGGNREATGRQQGKQGRHLNRNRNRNKKQKRGLSDDIYIYNNINSG